MGNPTRYFWPVQTGSELSLRPLLVAVVATTLLFLAGVSSSSFAAKGGTPGKPDDGGGGGAAPDLGDLIILYRDQSGVPYLTADSCQQPLPSDTCPAECVLVDGVPSGVDVLPVDPDTCAVAAACGSCTEEVDFGRINAARSPDAVFDAQLADVIVNLATADCRTLDPAGRLVATRVEARPERSGEHH